MNTLFRLSVEHLWLALPADAQFLVVRLDQTPEQLRRAAQLFFDPLQFHLQSADLFEQLPSVWSFGLLGLRSPVGEQLAGSVKQLLFPGVDHSRVDT